MGANLELLLRVFVDERRADDAEFLDLRWERHRTGHLRPRRFRRFYDAARRLVKHLVVIGLEADAYPLTGLLGDHRFLAPTCKKLFENSHYSAMAVTTPAPTVRPPSRMA